MVTETFQIYSVKITGNTLMSLKTESVQFYSCPQAKLPRSFLSLSPRQAGIPIPYGVEKITKIDKGIGYRF